ncbi:sensor histidine kinase [Anaeromyxobacter oryzae]|uniref:histidine kinase n=1 Tax=Anaeromyxobacter oryzae TaxID=2918170 RepID=A0ABM7WNN3_9BACT|nr:AAA family ATPase [Anaeromyxobacter oryzae]BDG01076.1 serine/threonine protein kinase [Anaeromyxobacter oryzae]
MMHAPPQYTTRETLSNDGRTALYRAIRDLDHVPVVLKVLDSERCRPKDVERLRHEHEIGITLEGGAVVKPLALETYQGLPVLVLEDFGGESLDSGIAGPMATDRFLALSVGIAGAVSELHQQGVIHRDLKPENILVHPRTLEVKLADLGLATRLPREQQAPRPPLLIEGSLPYMSPEQTGRMNRAVDSRTDLYSLGVTFFQMLTGRLPFEARDPLEWVHCHVARAPPSVSQIVPGVPEQLERIVAKLLAKMADDRYQTARGLESDLERCLAEWRATQHVAPFPPGQRDVPDRLQIPQRLYGRDREIAALLGAFERVVDTGAPELLLVSGYSGIGKSSLVHEIQKPIVRRWGLFAEGKFDQYKRDIPYSTLAQSFRRLVLDVVAEGADRIAEWRERLGGALGMNGGLIAGIIPDVELIIGRQPAVPELPLTEAKNRFHLVFRQFLGVFACKDHPLTLFLDDLQWADAASFELLADVLTHAETRYLLAIGAYRDNEVDAAHPLVALLARLRTAIPVRELVLPPLSREHLDQFVADALRSSPEQTAPLTDLVAEKTAGNPFFAIQFLLSLRGDRLIRFDADTLAWRFDAASARAKGYTDNVVELMVAKLQRLSGEAQEAVMLAACVGNVTGADTLALLRGRSEEQTHRDLWELVREGLLDRSRGRYRFSHDRVQQAAYALIPADRRSATHLRIGQLLLAHTPAEQLPESVFDIVNQLDLGSSLIIDRREKQQVARLDLIAGRRAKASAAYDGAARYVRSGIALLGDEGWTLDYPLAYGLHLELAQLEYLLGDRARSQELVATLLAHARDEIDKAAAYEFLVDLHTTQGDNEKAIDAALQCISLFGIELTPHPTREEVQRDYDELWRKLGERQIEDLIDLPAMTDRETQAALGALAAPTVAAMFTDLNLLLRLSCQMVNLCLGHGNADASAVGYVWLGITLGPVFGKYQEGYRFGKLAYDYVQKHRLVALKPRIDICFGDLINFWTKPLKGDLEYLREGFRAAVEVGDLTYACYCANHMVTVMLTQGSPLETVLRESEVRLDFVRKAGYAPVVDEIVSMQRFIQDMRGLTASFSAFDDATFDQRAFEQHLEREVRPLTVCWYFILKLAARFMSGDYAEALDASERARALLWSTPGHMQVPEYHYFRALSLAAAHGGAPPEKQREYLEALRGHDAQFREWADNCAANFASKSALVSAEVARVTGDDLGAMRLYERAIQCARDSGFVQNEAIAYELASRFYRARGFVAFADSYLRDARACYQRWGADGKVRQLERLHPDVLEFAPFAPSATIAVRSEHLDLLSVMKASETIAGEILFDRLLGTLLKVALEQGGAQRVCLVLARGEDLTLEAEAVATEDGVTTRLLPSVPVGAAGAPRQPAAASLVPASIVEYARRTREPVILNDAATDPGRFASDPYLTLRRPRSVLCLPILRQAELVGLLYQENGLVTGAFTPDRLIALRLLASRAAISMQNARLLAEERAARTAAEDARRTAEQAKAAAEEAEHRSAFLAEAGALLAGSLDVEETLVRLGQLCVRSLADWCLIDLLDGRQIRRIAGAHADPAKEPVLEQLRKRYPPRLDAPHPAARVLRSGEPLLVSDLTDEVLRSFCDDDEHVRLVSEMGSRSAVIVPLLARGKPLGALTLTSGTRGRYGRTDLELARELADRAAIAIDNAQLYREAQRAIRIRDEFLSIASHELRTPIQSLQLVVQSLERGAHAGRIAPRMLTIAARETERLAALVAQLLDVVRIQGGRLKLALEDCDLVAETRQVVERMQVAIERAGSPVTLHAAEAIAGRWDRSRIDQLLTNLLSNALSYGASKPIDLTLARTDGGVRITVRDHGIGISPDRLPHVFERFERATNTRHYGGLGLGLFIARQIVQAHQGSIAAESDLGRGSTFTVELPLQPREDAPG